MKARTGDPQPFQTRDGRWRVAVQRGHGSREHRNRTYLSGSSKQEVLARRDEILRADAEGQRPPDRRLSTGTYLRRWLASLQVRERTAESYTMTLEKHVIPRIGGIALSQLGPLDLDAMLADMARSKVRPPTRAYALRVLSIALNAAVTRKRLIPYNPALGADRPTFSPRKPVALSPADAAALLRAVSGDRLAPLFVLALSTGLRRGELLALTWSDWDRDARLLTVDETMHYRPGRGYEPGPTKSDSGKRVLRLSGVATRALAAQSKQQAAERLAAGRRWTDNGLVFTGQRRPGGALSGATVVHALHRLEKAAGLPAIRFHDLRHTYGTFVTERVGIDLARPSMGHRDRRTTERYVHIDPTSDAVADAVDEALSGAVVAAVVAK